MPDAEQIISELECMKWDIFEGTDKEKILDKAIAALEQLKHLQNVSNCLNDRALQALEDMESDVPCEMMCGYDWCEENCDSKNGAKKKCWAYYLMEWKEDE